MSYPTHVLAKVQEELDRDAKGVTHIALGPALYRWMVGQNTTTMFGIRVISDDSLRNFEFKVARSG